MLFNIVFTGLFLYESNHNELAVAFYEPIMQDFKMSSVFTACARQIGVARYHVIIST